MNAALRIALYEPDIAANTGAIMRLCACLGIGLDIIEPCGFVLDDKRLRRAGMDYLDHLSWQRHRSWTAFRDGLGSRRLILLTTKADRPYHHFAFRPDDILLMGRESAGVPEDIYASADARIAIPMRSGLRSLNVSMAAAIVSAEALRQIGEHHETRIAEAR